MIKKKKLNELTADEVAILKTIAAKFKAKTRYSEWIEDCRELIRKAKFVNDSNSPHTEIK